MDQNQPTESSPAQQPPPTAAQSNLKQLHPKSVWLFFFQSLFSAIILTFFVSIYALIPLLTLNKLPNISMLVGIPVLFLLFPTVIAYFWAQLSYKYYKYELREDGFRKEHGVIWKKYVTIPYERIQNVDIHRGIIARIVGLSDLSIQTAGMNGASRTIFGFGGDAEGKLPGILPQEAEQIRDELIRRARSRRDQGL